MCIRDRYAVALAEGESVFFHRGFSRFYQERIGESFRQKRTSAERLHRNGDPIDVSTGSGRNGTLNDVELVSGDRPVHLGEELRTRREVLIDRTCLLYTSDAADDLTRVDL